MNSPQIIDFIHHHKSLFWYIPEAKKEEISTEVLVEIILNYGDIKAVKQLINLLGIDIVATHFYSLLNKSERKK